MRVREHTTGVVLDTGVVFQFVGGLAVQALVTGAVDDTMGDGFVPALPKYIGLEFGLACEADRK
jgi:uncharacterized membrane protein YdbT with pleckstrin-like domain